MAATITLHFDGIPDRVITATNAKLNEIARDYGVDTDDYATTEAALTALQSNLADLIKRPNIHGQNQRNNVTSLSDDFE